MTIRFGYSSNFFNQLSLDEKSIYASSITTIPLNEFNSLFICSSLNEFPDGLLGEQMNKILEFSLNSAIILSVLG